MPDSFFNKDLSKEFIFATSRSSGPGGQNVNKLNTKVELRFDAINSVLLTEEEKDLIFDKLHKKISIEGFLILSCQSERSQLKNKELVVQRFYELIENALAPIKPRIKTKPSKSARKKRLENKQKHSTKKTLRKKPEIE